MRLRYIYAVAVLALAIPIASCSTVSQIAGFTVDEQTANIAIAASVGAERTAEHVLKLDICAEGKKTVIDGCVTAADGDTIIKYTRGLQAARDSLKTAVRADPNGAGAYVLYKAVTSATSKLKTASGAKS